MGHLVLMVLYIPRVVIVISGILFITLQMQILLHGEAGAVVVSLPRYKITQLIGIQYIPLLKLIVLIG